MGIGGRQGNMTAYFVFACTLTKGEHINRNGSSRSLGLSCVWVYDSVNMCSEGENDSGEYSDDTDIVDKGVE